MNFHPDIRLYETDDQTPVHDDLLTNLGKGAVKVKKKLDMYAQMYVLNLVRSETLDPIAGNRDGLYELKVKCLPTPVRFVCALKGRILILLAVFFTSGSGSEVMRHVPVALNRLAEWQSRQTNQNHEPE